MLRNASLLRLAFKNLWTKNLDNKLINMVILICGNQGYMDRKVRLGMIRIQPDIHCGLEGNQFLIFSHYKLNFVVIG